MRRRPERWEPSASPMAARPMGRPSPVPAPGLARCAASLHRPSRGAAAPALPFRAAGAGAEAVRARRASQARHVRRVAFRQGERAVRGAARAPARSAVQKEARRAASRCAARCGTARCAAGAAPRSARPGSAERFVAKAHRRSRARRRSRLRAGLPRTPQPRASSGPSPDYRKAAAPAPARTQTCRPATKMRDFRAFRGATVEASAEMRGNRTYGRATPDSRPGTREIRAIRLAQVFAPVSEKS